MTKTITLYILALFFVIPATAQIDSVKHSRKLLYYFNGGIGLYLPTSTHGALHETGFASSFQFQVDYKKHYFSRLYLDQYNIAFSTKLTDNDGSQLTLKGKVPTTMIGLDAGYNWHIKKFSPYIFTGAGIAITDVPILEQISKPGNTTLTTQSQSALSFRGGVGVDYKISRFFILYFESQLLSFPITTQIYNGNLNGISLQVGFKTPLQ
jgi:opacity protein-like surface antigen